MRRIIPTAVLMLLALGTACERNPVTVPDLEDYTLPKVRYMCRCWYEGRRPQVEKGLFDVYFGGRPQNVPATVAQLDQVHEAHGIIVHKFNAPVVRTLISVDSLEALVDRNLMAWGVPDADAFPVRLGGWTREKLTEDGRDFLAGLGVVILLEGDFGSGTILGINVPDASLPEIWAWEKWRSIEISIPGCYSCRY